jgi:hypothetical protein
VDKYTVAKLMEIIGNYFRPALGAQKPAREIGAAIAATEQLMAAAGGEPATLLQAVPELREEIAAMLTLAHTGEALVTPIIAASTASGTLLRRKLEPVLEPLLRQYAVLRKTAHAPSGSRVARRTSVR